MEYNKETKKLIILPEYNEEIEIEQPVVEILFYENIVLFTPIRSQYYLIICAMEM